MLYRSRVRPEDLLPHSQGDLSDYGITLEMLRDMYPRWCNGEKTSDLERRYPGKLFSALVREHLGIETERKSHLTTERDGLAREVSRLRAILDRHGIDHRESR